MQNGACRSATSRTRLYASLGRWLLLALVGGVLLGWSGMPAQAQGFMYPPVDFGKVSVDTDKDLVWTVIPYDRTEIYTVRILGADANQFRITSDRFTGGPYNGSTTATVTIRFTPRRSGRVNAQMVFTGYFADGTGIVPLTGRGTCGIDITTNAPADGVYKITPDPRMPFISATAKIANANPDPTASTRFEWTAEIRYDASSVNRQTRKIDVTTAVTPIVGGQNPYTPDFGDQIRGGDLTLVCRATIGGKVCEERADGLKIVGQEPVLSALREALQNDILRRIAKQESGRKQFEADGMPKWNRTRNGGPGDGGAGIMQITPANDDQVWSWRSNVDAAVDKLNDAIRVSTQYPARVEKSQRFTELVNNYNTTIRRGKKPIVVTVPPFTAGGSRGGTPNFNADPAVMLANGGLNYQLELNCIRIYNGVPGTDGFGNKQLMEFMVETSRLASGVDVVVVDNVDETKLTGVARWRRVDASERSSVGDPNYVANVLRQPTF